MKHRLNQPFAIIIAVVLMGSALFATAALSTKTSAGDKVRERAKAVLRVDGMTCGGCIATIEKSLAGFEGIEDVQVDIVSGTTEILYDSALDLDGERMAAAITANGYPATVMRTLSPDQIREQDRANTARSEKAIASVGGVEIPRSDFEIEMAHVHSRYQMAYGENAMASDQGQRLLNNLKVQIARRLVDESIQLQEVRSAGFTVDPSMVAQQYEVFWKERGFADQTTFEGELEENGYSPDYFLSRFKNRVLINAYIDQRVINANLNDIEKQRRYTEWFANARLLTTVTFYDKDLERLIQQNSTAGSCGNACSSK